MLKDAAGELVDSSICSRQNSRIIPMRGGSGMGGVIAGFMNKFLTWGITMIHRSRNGTLSKDHRILQRMLNSDIDRPQQAHLSQSAGFG
jgi:hypothetical protein